MDAYAVIHIIIYSILAFLVLGLFPTWYQHRIDTRASAKRQRDIKAGKDNPKSQDPPPNSIKPDK